MRDTPSLTGPILERYIMNLETQFKEPVEECISRLVERRGNGSFELLSDAQIRLLDFVPGDFSFEIVSGAGKNVTLRLVADEVNEEVLLGISRKLGVRGRYFTSDNSERYLFDCGTDGTVYVDIGPEFPVGYVPAERQRVHHGL